MFVIARSSKAVVRAAFYVFGSPCRFTILGSLGSPLTGWIRDITGSYRSAWELAILILAIGLVSLILAHPPVHPSLAQNRANPMAG
jgi:cyanate permease